MKGKILGLLAVGLLAGSMAANATTVTLDFENVLTPNSNGVYPEAFVGEFYNGGTSGAVGSATGPDYDTRFDNQSVAARSIGSGGTASFGPSASGPGAEIGVGALVLIGRALRIDFLEPIIGEISLTHSSTIGGSVELLSDALDGQGNRLQVGTANLAATLSPGAGSYNVWARQTIQLTGGATSMFIRGTIFDVVIDNITFRRESNTVPEPGTLALLGLGLAGLGLSCRRKAN